MCQNPQRHPAGSAFCTETPAVRSAQVSRDLPFPHGVTKENLAFEGVWNNTASYETWLPNLGAGLMEAFERHSVQSSTWRAGSMSVSHIRPAAWLGPAQGANGKWGPGGRARGPSSFHSSVLSRPVTSPQWEPRPGGRRAGGEVSRQFQPEPLPSMRRHADTHPPHVCPQP